jgi:hypothetical protein
MAIQFPDFQRISYDEANPLFKGMNQGQQFMQNLLQFPQDLQSKILANEISKVQAKYAEPNAQAFLKTAQQHNQFDPRIWESEIGLRGAQAGLAGSEAQKNRFLTKNPQYISPEGMLMTQAIEQQQRMAQQQAQQGQGQQQPPQIQMPQNMGGQMGGGGQSPAASIGNSSPGAQPQGGGQQPAIQQPLGAQGAQYSQTQYHPDALAFNPPSLQSPTGNPALDNLYYKKFGMSPVVQTQLDLSKAQAEKYQQQNIERNKEFNNQSVFANESTLNAHKFLDALDRSSSLERGYLGGKSPAVTNAAQEMETYGANMAAAATKLFQGDNAVHAADIELQQMAKPNRKQNADVSFDLAQGVIAKNDRLKEKQQFYSQGTQLGLKPEIMDSMWNKYETDRPYIDADTKMPNDAYKGSFRDYLNPEAVNEFLQGKDYMFPNQKVLENANWKPKDLTQIKTWAKKNNLDPKDFSKKNLYKLAKSEHITLAQLKQELRARGAI